MKMDIISYLLELLETRKSVGIDTLGTLYKKKIPGRYDSETHSFLPPKYEIAFKTDVKEDHDLANYICEKRNISIESAIYYVTEFAENIQAQLEDHQYADLLPIGNLKFVDDQIVLEPSETVKISQDFYGLPSVSAIIEDRPTQPEESTIVIEPLSNIEEQQLDEQSIHDETTEADTLQNKSDNLIANEEHQTPAEDTNHDIEDHLSNTEEENLLDEQSIDDEIAEANALQNTSDNLVANEVNVEDHLITQAEDTNYGIEEPLSNTEEERDEQPVYDEIAEADSLQAINDKPITTEVNNHAEVDEKKTTEVEQSPITNESTTENVDNNPSSTPITDPLWKPTVITRYEYDEEDEDEEENKGRGFKKFLRIILALAIIIGIIVGLSYFLYPDLFYRLKAGFSYQSIESGTGEIVDSTNNNDSNSSSADSAKSIVISHTIENTDTLKEIPNESVTYEVIGSAMKTQKKVDEVISNLSKIGINAKKMETMPGRLIKISLGTFTDFNSAKKFQDSLKIKLKNPEIYIQTIKPNN